MCHLVFLLLHLVLITAVVTLDASTEASLRQRLRDLIRRDAAEQGQPEKLRLIGGLLRLAFHDCVGTRCDGCINRGLTPNAGLEPYVVRMEQFYRDERLSGVISRADLWALAGSEAVIFSSELATCTGCRADVPLLSFQWGREDCPTTPWDNVNVFIAGPSSNAAQILDFFSGQFGLTTLETVAIMGGHTLGEAHTNGSGFSGNWTPQSSHFNNAFYKELLDKSRDWRMFNAGTQSNPRWQWVDRRPGSTPLMMLDADVSLVKTLNVNQDGLADCSFKTCRDSQSTLFYVQLFAKKNSLWVKSFSQAFTKMISHGYSSLKNVTP